MAAKTTEIDSTKTTPRSTKEHLIDVGLNLMRRHGYGATGLQEILKAADVPKGSFYHHFGSKEEFAAAVLERYVSLASKHAEATLMHGKQAPLKRLRRYFEELIAAAGQQSPIPGCLLGSFSLEVAGSNPALQTDISKSFTTWQTGVAVALREAVEKGDLAKSMKPDMLAGFVLNSWEGALLRSQADKSDEPLRVFLHYVFEELLAK
ncbi:transcriptional regulator, TetR family [Bryocella elongata]|uniref:Transcriptional regulator, TetR family n=1 Tax=Bryocella elongata TaxID=863522 RepID=A0A1H5YN90_9BACT|nr:TetR/AcrR family transcriptional regulator [Bryocella elongata]SEG25621.1 transcriptional regulator, TetR family [Bryocella elongata]